MARRISDQGATITVLYNDRNWYDATVSVPGSRTTWKGRIYPPASGYAPGIAYDSPRAYDEVARAALAFSADEGFDAGHEVRREGAASSRPRGNPGERKQIGEWVIYTGTSRGGGRVVYVESPDWSDSSFLYHDRVLRWDFPERIPAAVKQAASRMLKAPHR